MKNSSNNLFLTIILLLSFVIVFGNKIYKFDYKTVLFDSYNRLKTINHTHLIYSNKIENKINFIRNNEYTDNYKPRYGYVNQFDFHPYWSLEKGQYIYNNNITVFRLSRSIEKYFNEKKINLIEICAFNSNNDKNVIFKNSKNNFYNKQNKDYLIIESTFEYTDYNDFSYWKIYDNEKIIVAEILINNNDNLNFFYSNYEPMIMNRTEKNIVIDAYKTNDGYLKLVIFSKSNKEFSYILNDYNSSQVNEVYSNHRTFDDFMSQFSLQSNENLRNLNYIQSRTLKCSSKNI